VADAGGVAEVEGRRVAGAGAIELDRETEGGDATGVPAWQPAVATSTAVPSTHIPK